MAMAKVIKIEMKLDDDKVLKFVASVPPMITADMVIEEMGFNRSLIITTEVTGLMPLDMANFHSRMLLKGA